jgi:hypothetical protein
VNLHTDILASDVPDHWRPAIFRDGTGTNGSGTPFYLWPKTQTRPWGDVFGVNAPVFGQDPSWKVT